MTPNKWLNPQIMLLLSLFLGIRAAHGDPDSRRSSPDRATTRTQPVAADAHHPPRLQLLLNAYDQLKTKQWSELQKSIALQRELDWPEPFASLRRQLLLAAIFGAQNSKMSDLTETLKRDPSLDPTLGSNQESIELAARKLNLHESLRGAAPEKPPVAVKLKGPQADLTSTKKKKVVLEREKLAELRSAWRSGRHEEANRLASEFSFNPHRTSCQAGWIYGQFVLGRAARSNQARKTFFKHQIKVGSNLYSRKCQASHFAMDEQEFIEFRLNELNWTARLYWENNDLKESARYAVRALSESLDQGQPASALESLQVLFGRIAFENRSPEATLKDLESWIGRIREQTARNADGENKWASTVSWMNERIALFEFQARRYDSCSNRLGGEIKNKLKNDTADTWDKRRLLARLAFWRSRCAALGNDVQAREIVILSHQLVRHFAPTGYYAMLVEQSSANDDVSGPNEGRSPPSHENLLSSALPWPKPPLRDPDLMQKVSTSIETMRGDPELTHLSFTHPFHRLITRWFVELFSDQEHLIYEDNPSTFEHFALLMKQMKNYKDLILSGGRLSRFVDLNAPSAKSVMGALFPPAWISEFQQAEKLCNTDWRLLYAVARQESLFDPLAVSPAGARGVLQVMPFVWNEFFQNPPASVINHNLNPSDPFDPRSNIIVGACHLRETLQHYGGNLTHALAGYNAGKSAVDQWITRRPTADMELYVEFIPYAETKDYVQRILRSLHQMRQPKAELVEGG